METPGIRHGKYSEQRDYPMTRVDEERKRTKALAFSMRKMNTVKQEKIFVYGTSTWETVDDKGFRKVVKTHRDPNYTTTTLYNPEGEWISHTDSRGDFK